MNGIKRFNDYLTRHGFAPASYPATENFKDMKEQLSQHYRGQMPMPQASINQRTEAHNMLEPIMKEIKMAAKLRKEMAPKGFNAKEQYQAITAAHSHYIQGMKQIAQKIAAENADKDVDASFSPYERRLPSQTYNKKRCAIYHKDWMMSPNAIAIRILLSIGAIEKHTHARL